MINLDDLDPDLKSYLEDLSQRWDFVLRRGYRTVLLCVETSAIANVLQAKIPAVYQNHIQTVAKGGHRGDPQKTEKRFRKKYIQRSRRPPKASGGKRCI